MADIRDNTEFQDLCGLVELAAQKYLAGEATWNDVLAAETDLEDFTLNWFSDERYAEDLDYRCECEQCQCYKAHEN